MIRTTLLAALLLTAATPMSPAFAAPADDLKRLLDDHWAWYLRGNPEQASELGERAADGKLSDLSLAGIDREAAEAKALLARAEAIPADGLSPADRVNRDVLRRLLAGQVEGARFGQRAMLFTNRGGWHLNYARLAEQTPLATPADYASYVTRLEGYPKLNADGIATTRVALKGGFVQPCAPMQGFEQSITTHIVDAPEKSAFWLPFAGAKPSTVSDSEWTALKARAAKAISGGVVPAYREFATFYKTEYAPKCRQAVGASALADGKAYYDYRIRQMTTTDRSADDIHQLGLSEVARIRAEMDAVVKKSGFQGDRAAYIAKLRTDPQYYPKTPAELMEAAGALAKQIDGWMPRLFGKLPRLPYTVKEIPADIAPGTTTAYYEPGSPETGRAGIYRVNTSKLDQRPLFELPALGVHEAVPGHHHQIALAQELDLPKFRRHAAFFTAFVEGWGLYSERLGIEMGLYDTPEKDMGRLSYEMWRACRLVVDTGMHSKGWSKEQAVKFMTDNTALSAGNIDAEVNRYITWPGQALAYKIGELTIRRLRTDAEQQLGAKFDLRGFHDAVLEQGAVPLDVLETQVKAWVAAQKG